MIFNRAEGKSVCVWGGDKISKAYNTQEPWRYAKFLP